VPPKRKVTPELKTARMEIGAVIAEALAQQHGEENVGTGASDRGVTIALAGVIPTGVATIDEATGRGGIPYGRLTVLTGAEGTGKTTLALTLASQVHGLGGVCFYLDTEKKLDRDYARALGVSLENLIVGRPDTLEGAFELAESAVRMVHAKNVSVPVLIVLDSIHGSVPSSEYGLEYSKATPAAQARVMSRAIPRIFARVGSQKVAFVFISQYRETIGMYSAREKVGGGNAVKFFASLVLELARKTMLEEQKRKAGSVNICRVTKNQIAAPFGEGEFVVRWGAGIDRDLALIEVAKKRCVAEQSTGGWVRVLLPGGEIVKWQGDSGMRRMFKERPELPTLIRQSMEENRQLVVEQEKAEGEDE